MATSDDDGVAPVPQLLEDARALSRRGRYPAAINLLEQARVHHKGNLELLFETAEIQTIQGYINRAHALVTGGADEAYGIVGDMLRMLKCFLEPMIWGCFSASVEEAEHISRKYHHGVPTDSEWMHIATIRLYYFKVLGLYSVFHHVEGKGRMESAQIEVINIVELFLQARDFDNAFKFCNVLLRREDKLKKLSSILAVDEVPLLVRAKAQLELAELLQGSERKQRRQELRLSARSILEQEHRHAALDIDLAQALEDISLSNELDLGNLLQAYHELDYPNGSKSWLHKLLDIATALHNYDLQHALEKDLEALSVKTGTLCLAKVTQVNHIARFHQKTGNDDLIKSTLQNLYHDLTKFDVPFTLGQVGFILTDIFVRYREVANASAWAHICNSHWRACPPNTQTMGRMQLLRSEIMKSEILAASDYQAVQNFCDQLVDSDLADGLYQEAAMKLDTILGFFYTWKMIPQQDRITQIQNYLARIEGILDSITDSDTRLQRAGVLQQKATFYLSLGSQLTNCAMEQTALETLEKALELTYSASNRTLTYQLIVIRQQMGLVLHTFFTKLRRSDPGGSKRFLVGAEECFRACLEGYEAMSSTFQVAETKYWIALVKYEARIQDWATSDQVLQALLEAEAGYDDRRNEISMSSGISAIRDKQALAKEKHVRDVYRFAFQLCVLDGHGATAWQWVQKAKARSLSDTLGLGCLVPESLLTLVFSDDTSREIYERERALLQHLQSPTSEDKFAIGLELRKLQEQMRTIPALKALLDLRQGRSITAEELIARWNRLPIGGYGRNVAFVDWYVKGDEEIYVLILQPARELVFRKVNASTHDVRSWIEEFLNAEEGRTRSLHRSDDHPSQTLRAMDCLVEVVGDHVDEDVLLVLSPAAPLDALPLHALHVQRSSEQRSQRAVPLIERNPIVYCSNLTVFLQCCELAASKIPRLEMKSTYMAVYEGTPTESCDIAEQQAVYETMENLASECNASATTGSNVDREKISVEWSGSDYILFHGHCNISSQDITEQSLMLTHKSPSSQDSAYLNLSVRDIFGLKLQGPLVSLMACGSSKQKIEAGDEPLGLVTALLCVGAASVIGTLWPVASGTARRFATTFGQKMKLAAEERRTEPSALSQIIDLTVVLQQTVGHLRRSGRTRTPYHWAAFVLHGSTLLSTGQPKAVERIALADSESNSDIP